MAALCLVSASHAYTLSSFLAFAGFLAVDLGWSTDLDHAGIAVGVLGAVLPASRIPVSLLWGLAMDRFGRRPCLVLTSCCLMVGSLLFPFATGWWAAVTTRFVVLGMGNGWVTLMAPCCAELGGATHQATLLGYVIGAGGFINLVGPAVGGYTYHFFGSPFPALVPCLFGALLAALAALTCHRCFPETRPPRRKAKAAAYSSASLAGSAEASASDEVLPGEISLSIALRTYPLPLLVCLRCLLGALGFCMMTLIPLWAIASVDAGGLALDHEQLGLMLACSAGVALLYSTLLMAKVIGRLGVRRTIVASGIVQLCCVFMLPRMQGSPFVLIVLVNAAQVVANSTCFTSTIAAVNNVCSQYPHKRGAINGVNVTVESCAKSFGPSLGGSLYSWAIGRRAPPGWPNASVLYFSALTILYALFSVGAAQLPTSIDRVALTGGAKAPKTAHNAATSPPGTEGSGAHPAAVQEVTAAALDEERSGPRATPRSGASVVRWVPLSRAGRGSCRGFSRLDGRPAASMAASHC